MAEPINASRPVRAKTKTELVHDTIRAGILTHEFKPGEYLNIDELARRFGMSPIPVREAVARLASERLVVIQPHVGAEVAHLDEASVHDVFALLEGLESAAAERIVQLTTDEDVEALQALVATMEDAPVRDNLDRWAVANAAFHLRMAGIAALPLVFDELRIAYDHWERIRRHYFQAVTPQRTAGAQKEHRAMVAAITQKDSAELELLLRSHNRAARAGYLKMLKASLG